MPDLPSAITKWFLCWNTGAIDDLPITEDFRHTSPFGTIDTKDRYLEIIDKNRDAFLGNTLVALKHIQENDNVCVQFRQTRDDDDDFEMIVCEWYLLDGDKIREIRSFYNVGDAKICG